MTGIYQLKDRCWQDGFQNMIQLYTVYKKLTSNSIGRLQETMEKYVSGRQRKAGASMLIPDKVYFRAKKTTRDRKGHTIMIKR